MRSPTSAEDADVEVAADGEVTAAAKLSLRRLRQTATTPNLRRRSPEVFVGVTLSSGGKAAGQEVAEAMLDAA